MTEQSQPIPQPHFVIDVDEAAVEDRIRVFEQDVAANPEQYNLLLSDLNEAITAESLSPRDVRATNFESMEVQGDAIARLTEFFKYRFDSLVSFDDATEASLRQDPDYTVKRARMSGAQAETIRDELRRLRFRHYVGRVIAWKQQNQNIGENSSDELRSAS